MPEVTNGDAADPRELDEAPADARALSQLFEVLRARGATVRDLRLDRSKLDAVRFDEVSATVEAGAGVAVVELERQAQAHRLSLGALAPEAWGVSVGALLEHPWAAFRVSQTGALEPIASRVSGVLADGTTLTDAPVRGPGPSLAALLVGAGATLGLVTSATLRLAPWASAERRLSFSFGNPGQAIDALRSAVGHGVAFARARVGSRAGRALVECTLRAPALGLERQLSLLTACLERDEGRFEGHGSVGAISGESREVSWASVASAVTQGDAVELYRLATSMVVAKGARASDRAPPVERFTELFDPKGVLVGGVR